MSFALQSSCILPRTTELSVYWDGCALANELLFGSSSCWRHPFSRHFTFPSLPTNYCFSYVHPLVPCPPFWVFSGQKEGTPTYAVTGSSSYLLSLCSLWDPLAFWTFSPVCSLPFHWLLPVACTHLYQLPWTRGAPIPSIFDFTLPYSYLDTFDRLALMTAPVILTLEMWISNPANHKTHQLIHIPG